MALTLTRASRTITGRHHLHPDRGCASSFPKTQAISEASIDTRGQSRATFRVRGISLAQNLRLLNTAPIILKSRPGPLARHSTFRSPFRRQPIPLFTMARNSEKAQSMLFRFRAAQAAESGLLPTSSLRRPKAPSTVSTIPLCEKWRGQILKEVSRKVTKIQDESLSDFQVRDLNDEINKLMKEKWGWERRIRELGGPNYMRGGGAVFDDQGREVQGGGKGYRYFGRARELPGVKEMFERAAKRRTQGDDEDDKPRAGQDISRKNLDATYFGFGLDEEDGTLLKYERKKEKEAVERIARSAEADQSDEEWETLPGDAGDGVRWRLPTLEEVQDELVDRRRRQLLEKLV